MRFEWDDAKEEANIAKHEIDFDSAIDLFDGRTVFETQSAYTDEERWQRTGIVDERFMTVIWTRRGDAIRIISARRARTNEKRNYHDNHS
jgi:uncharacterized DUF497 family protein